MAKNMARITDDVVVNIEWCSDRQAPTDTLINLGDRPVAIGDTFDGADFYRNGEKVLTPLEAAHAEIEDMRAALALLEVNANG